MIQNLLNLVKVLYVNDAIAAASNTDDDSSIVDTAGFDGCLFLVPITDSVITGVATMTVEQNTANSGSGMAALSGAQAQATSAANDDLNNQYLAVDVYRPRERYLRTNLVSATANIAFGATIAILYSGVKAPVTQTAVAASAVVASPAEA